MQSRIGVGEMEGFLAYDGDDVVGWLNAQPRHRLPHCFERLRIDPPPIECAPHQAAVVLCFVIAPSHRRRGVARSLLRQSIAALAQRGFVLIDAFPFKAGDSTDATDHYHGPASLFLAEGFVTLRDEESMTVMRKTLV